MWPFRRLSLGSRGERIARGRLRSSGYKILAAPYLCKVGEIDIVASKSSMVVFVEVKTRRSDHFGEPELAVDQEKRRRITKTAVHFLKTHKLIDCGVRFDVIAILLESGWFSKPVVRHIESAFDAEGSWSL